MGGGGGGYCVYRVEKGEGSGGGADVEGCGVRVGGRRQGGYVWGGLWVGVVCTRGGYVSGGL